MKKRATARPAKAPSRQSTLNFPTSSEADLVAESTAAESSSKRGAKNRRKSTADFADDADKHNKSYRRANGVEAFGSDGGSHLARFIVREHNHPAVRSSWRE